MAQQFPLKTLLAITGLTPQVVTETLYGIARQEQEKALLDSAYQPFWPNELIVLTTKKGAEQAKLGLLEPRPLSQGEGSAPMLDQCTDEIGMPRFTPEQIKIVTIEDHLGQAIDDARSKADQEALADFIVKQVACLCAESTRQLHASLAGGRKTMTFYLGYAMSLFARPQDCLSHVLINNPDYEGLREFYFPTKATRTIAGRQENQLLDICRDKVDVELADIPFIRQREQIGGEVLNYFSQSDCPVNFRALVQQQNIANQISLDFDAYIRAVKQQRRAQKKAKQEMLPLNLPANPFKPLELCFDLAGKSVAILFHGEQIGVVDMQSAPLELAYFAMIARHDTKDKNNLFSREIAVSSKIKGAYLTHLADLYRYELAKVVYPEKACDDAAKSAACWDSWLKEELAAEGIEAGDLTAENLRGCYRTIQGLGSVDVTFFDDRKKNLRKHLKTKLPKELVKLIEPDVNYYFGRENKSSVNISISIKEDLSMLVDLDKKEFIGYLGLKVSNNLCQ